MSLFELFFKTIMKAKTWPVTEEIPEHLMPFVADQDPSLYTPIDHASWRYIMRVSKNFFKKHAHRKYLDGLESTGISTEQIPLISEMDQKLRKLGWRAVGVVGFIPPSIFMEFQSLGILPIACDMRTLEHIAYTPAPDIVHEAAGHAPIIADPDYADYLRKYGEVCRYAIHSKRDESLYLAIRKLSDIKEDPKSTPQEIQMAQKNLERAIADFDYVSEAAFLARMAWWTIEYGLIGDLDQPLIYGAGLLSSVGESHGTLTDEVKKVPLTLDCLNLSYDITRPQPQLFVTPSFERLTEVLEEFAETMAYRRGGVEGLGKAKMAGKVTTTVLDSGLQVSGNLKNFLTDRSGNPIYLQYVGPTQLSHQDKELPGQGPKYHFEGFGSPLGILSKINKSPVNLTENDLRSLGFQADSQGTLKFQSGVVLEGKLKDRIERNGKNLVLIFEDCKVTLGEKILFDPSWGTFDMACGSEIPSVFGEAADRPGYLRGTGGFQQEKASQSSNLTQANQKLNTLYQELRTLRESSKGDHSALNMISNQLSEHYPEDWLLRVELLEMCQNLKKEKGTDELKQKLRNELNTISKNRSDLAVHISRGVELL